MSISPVALLLRDTAGGILAGVVGALLAGPVVAAFHVEEGGTEDGAGPEP